MANNIQTIYNNRYTQGQNDTKKGNATVSDVLRGKTFTSANGVNLTGTCDYKYTQEQYDANYTSGYNAGYEAGYNAGKTDTTATLGKNAIITVTGRLGYGDGDGEYALTSMILTYNPKTRKASVTGKPGAHTNAGFLTFPMPIVNHTVTVK